MFCYIGRTEEILDSEHFRTQYMLQRGVLGLFVHFKIYLKNKTKHGFHIRFLLLAFGT